MRAKLATIALVLSVGLMILVGFFGLAPAQDSPDHSPVFLVATPDLGDPLFSQSVILMLPNSKLPLVVGLIVNKPTQIGLAKLFPRNPALKGVTQTAFLGGPVDVETPAVLYRAARASPQATELFDGVYVSLDPSFAIDMFKRRPIASDVRLYLGRAQWAPEQLHGEMQEGSWYVLPADPEVVFSATPGQVWHTLVERAQMERALAPDETPSVPLRLKPVLDLSPPSTPAYRVFAP
ncbi:MAG TPA: YqgE/AlgH family protein [Candidatus Binataceae bacterium]|nr:YqgE/AlgH family protein [Candidatus Binataceae bacterium]